MARVQGPLHSDQASGTMAGALTFSKSGKNQYVRNRVTPHNPNTVSQRTYRTRFQTLTKHWPDISPADQATWDVLAIQHGTTRIAEYTRENIARLKAGLDATDVWPVDETPIVYPLTVTADSPPPVPDCTGNYEQIENINNNPAYRRVTQPYFYIYDQLPTQMTMYGIAPTTDSPESKWESAGNLEDTYTYQGEYAGQVVVSAPT